MVKVSWQSKLILQAGLLLLSAPVLPGQPSEFRFRTVRQLIVDQRLGTIPRGNRQRRERLIELFQESGCPDLQTVPIRRSSHSNVVCQVTGRTSETILVGAHYDTVADSFGVVDNWAGASLLSSLQEALSAAPSRYTFLFVGFAEEEKGLVGSKDFAAQLKKTGAIPRVMINLDTLGLGTTSIWASRSDRRLVEYAANLGQALQIPMQILNVDGGYSSDSESFRRIKVPVITFHSLTQQTLPLLHTRKDNQQALDRDSLYQTYRLLAAYLELLDRDWPPEQKP